MSKSITTSSFLIRISLLLYVVGLMSGGAILTEWCCSEFHRIDYYVMFMGAMAGLFFTVPLALAISGIKWVFTGEGL